MSDIVVEILVPVIVEVPSIGVRGPAGEDGPPGGGPQYTHTQSVANSSWTVAHNLGRNPDVATIVGDEIVDGRVTYPTLDSALVEFSSSVSGVALCY